MANPKPLSIIVDKLVTRVRSFERTRVRMEQLYVQHRIARRDIEHIYGAIYLATFSSFEGMLEDMFLKLVAGRAAPAKAVRTKAAFRSDTVVRGVVFGGRNYVDWLPYEITKKRADLFLSSGMPFRRLDQNDEKLIKAMSITRNAIAHQGGYARRKFDNEVVAPLALAPRDRTPLGFLRSLHSTTPNVTRYEQFARELIAICRKLT